MQRGAEVYRTPQADAGAAYGFAYRDRTLYPSGAFVMPLAAPAARLAVADLLL